MINAMRDRLVELIANSDTYDKYNCELCTKEDDACCRCYAERLADHLIANGVIVPPCDFQQKVYVLPTIENNLTNITEMKCIGFSLSCDSYVVNLINDKNKLYQPCFGRFGKTVFLTKEEAEKALKELKENGRE